MCPAETGLGRGPPPFLMFFGGLKIDTKMVPKKCPKWYPKGTPKVSQNHQNGLQKPSQNGVPKKHQKKIIFSTPECRQSVVNNNKIDDFHVLILTPSWVSFWRCFGSPNGGQSLQKGTSKKHQKNDTQNDPKLVLWIPLVALL